MAERVDEVLRSGKAPNVHGVVVMRDGQVLVEWYGAGRDYRLGDDLGHVVFGRDTLHDMRSVTKSVVALAYGIALKEGLVPEPGASLVGQFPEHRDLVEDPARAGLTIEHALTMTLGLEWDESMPYTSPANSEIAMEMSPDRHRYVLERPVVEEAGKRWKYCGGATVLVGEIIARGAGRPFDEYTADRLFAPLGIPEYFWSAGDDGLAIASSGLRLRPVDLAAIGQLVLDGGRDVVPDEWLQQALRPRVVIDDGLEYGYQWYIGTGERRWVAATGNGGQRLLVAPEDGLVAVVTAGEYDAEPVSAMAVLDAVLER